jgi:hypothetical protein
MRNSQPKGVVAQVYLEVIFGFMVGMLLLMAMIRVFQWAGKDLVKRREANDALLTTPVGSEAAGPLGQIRPVFYYAADMNATFNGAFLGDAFGP